MAGENQPPKADEDTKVSRREKEREKAYDLELVKRAQAGELKAFDELAVRHRATVYGFIYNMTGNHQDTDDLMQDVFLRAFRAIKRFRRQSAFSTWLYSISMNTTINFIKKRNRRPFQYNLNEISERASGDETFLRQVDKDNPRARLRLKEIQKDLNEALHKLSNKHRAVVVMFDVQGMSHRDISEVIGVSEGTVRSRLHYAHKQLQRYLRKYVDEA